MMSRKRGGFALLALGAVIAIGVASPVFNQAARATPAPDADVEPGPTQTRRQDRQVLAIGSVQPRQAPPSKGPVDKTKAAAGAVNDDAPVPTQGLITVAVDRQDALVLKALKDN